MTRQRPRPRLGEPWGAATLVVALSLMTSAAAHVEAGGLLPGLAGCALLLLTMDLLWLLASRGGEVVTKRELMAAVWGLPFGGGDRTVDVHISWLRRKLGETAAAPRYLHTVRGVGIRLVPPVDP